MATSHSFRQMGRYTLLEKLGAGGSGEVYLACSRMQNELVQFFAIKILNPDQSANPRAIRMLEREASLANVLKHNSLVSLYECGHEGETFFVAMDFVNGLSLSRYLQFCLANRQEIRVEYALFIARSVAAGLEFARNCKDPMTGMPLNIVHRDISPQNIMINFEGEVKLIDFGLARISGPGEKTQSGQIMGKLKYISPEHAKGESVDHRTDIFSLGIVLWEMLSGRRFYQDLSDAGIVEWLAQPEYSDLIRYNPSVKPELDSIVAKACAGNFAERFQTAGEFHDALNSYLNRNYPNFSPQEFKEAFRDTFQQEMLDKEKKMAEFIRSVGGDLNPKKFEKKFDQYADMVDSLGVITQPEPPGTKSSTNPSGGGRPSYRTSPPQRVTDQNSWVKVGKKAFSISWVITSLIIAAVLFSTKLTHKNREGDGTPFLNTDHFFESTEEFGNRLPASRPKLYPKTPIIVQISSKPSGALVYQNGKALRIKTPALVKVLDENSARIELEYPGYGKKSVTINPYQEELFVDLRESE